MTELQGIEGELQAPGHTSRTISPPGAVMSPGHIQFSISDLDDLG